MPPGAGDGSRFDTGRQDVTEIDRIDDQLAGYVEAMRRAYSEVESARTIDEVRDIRDRAEAARQYARAAGYSREITNMCAEIKLRAERKAGTLLSEMPKHPAGRPPENRSQPETNLPPTLADIGVSKTQSHRWQQTASVPDEVFEDYITSVREDETGTRDLITTSGLHHHAGRQRKPENPFASWSEDEKALLKQLRAGETIVVSLRAESHPNLCRWAENAGLFVRIDRRSDWGNPFEMPGDGDRETVIASYAEHYLPHKPSLLSQLNELRGKALGCWCAPEACHGDVLKAEAER